MREGMLAGRSRQELKGPRLVTGLEVERMRAEC